MDFKLATMANKETIIASAKVEKKNACPLFSDLYNALYTKRASIDIALIKILESLHLS
jgi:hypothetical protein